MLLAAAQAAHMALQRTSFRIDCSFLRCSESSRNFFNTRTAPAAAMGKACIALISGTAGTDGIEAHADLFVTGPQALAVPRKEEIGARKAQHSQQAVPAGQKPERGRLRNAARANVDRNARNRSISGALTAGKLLGNSRKVLVPPPFAVFASCIRPQWPPHGDRPAGSSWLWCSQAFRLPVLRF